jgi:hypothetical protein
MTIYAFGPAKSQAAFGSGLLRLLAAGLLLTALPALRAADERILPPSLPKEQRDNLLRFLKDHETPRRYVPKGAKVVDAAPPEADAEITATKDKPIKQYTVRIATHRPVPGEERVTRADVYYYRPNPTRGKPGLTVKYTVDLTTGKPVGDVEVLTRTHTPVSREEVTEAAEAVKERLPAVKALYRGRKAGAVRWEYLQMKILRKRGKFEPGDRVLRFVFRAEPREGEEPPAPIPVLVNLSRDLIQLDR